MLDSFPDRSINNRIGEHRFESKLFHSGIFRILQISVPIFRYNYEYIYIREIIYLRGDRSILEEENSSMNDFRKRKVDAGNT